MAARREIRRNGSGRLVSGDNGNGGAGRDIYVVRVERRDGETATPVCEGELWVPETEDISSLDDLLDAIKAYDLWDDGGEDNEDEFIQ